MRLIAIGSMLWSRLITQSTVSHFLLRLYFNFAFPGSAIPFSSFLSTSCTRRCNLRIVCMETAISDDKLRIYPQFRICPLTLAYLSLGMSIA